MRVQFKLLFFLFIFVAVLVLSGCSGSVHETSSNEESDNIESDDSESIASNKFPEKEITIVVSNAAGGSNDLAARAIAGPLQKILGVPVVVDNITGAGGNIARAQVFNAEPDGYTLLKTPIPSMTIGELVADGDFRTKEFEPVFNMFGNTSNVIIVPATSFYETVEDLIEASKERSLTASGSGMATNTALGSIFLGEIGVNHQYVPFDGGSEAAQQVAGGHVDFGIASEIVAQSLEAEGRIRVIATTGTIRMEMFPNAPTLLESGYSDLGFEILYGIWAPPGTPQDIIDKLAEAFLEASKDEAFIEAAQRVGFIEQILLPDQLREQRDFSFQVVERFKDRFEVD